jgi:chemotaxis protein MotB
MSFADVFAGLLLITIVGLVVLLHERQDENVQFSQNLVRVMNKVTSATNSMQEKITPLLPPTASRMQVSETQIVIPNVALFSSFGYDDYLKDTQKGKLLMDVCSALKESIDQAGEDRNLMRIVIEGHTDSDPVNATRDSCIQTNWELSSLRATGVLRYFKGCGLTAGEYNVIAVGLADTQPTAPNTKEEKSKNRRIIIRVEPDIDKIKSGL